MRVELILTFLMGGLLILVGFKRFLNKTALSTTEMTTYRAPTMGYLISLIFCLVAGLFYPVNASIIGGNQSNLQEMNDGIVPNRIIVSFDKGSGVQTMGVENPFLVIEIDQSLSVAEYESVVNYWENFPNVIAVEPDYIVHATDVVPDDPKFIFDSKGQYELREPGKIPLSVAGYYVPTYGINMPAAWELTTGMNRDPIYIAVIDTGYQPHEDMNGVWVGGYDFVSDPSISGDGDGYDPNPYGQHGHGVRVASVIGANTNNSTGIAGINWNARILPVRALGATGTGYLSDAAVALRWAAGLPVANAPVNPHPAKIINMSLGSFTNGAPCPLYLQSAIDDAYNRGAIIVVSAGNTSEDAQNYTPANCQRVITVGASYHLNMRAIASFSAYGPLVEIYAPGSNMITAEIQNYYTLGSGTSFSAPVISGVVSLMLDVNPALTFEEIVFILKNTALPFTSLYNCAEKSICGNTTVNPYGAIYEAMNWTGFPLPTETPLPPTVPPTATPVSSLTPTPILPTATVQPTLTYTDTPTRVPPTNTPTLTYTATWTPTLTAIPPTVSPQPTSSPSPTIGTATPTPQPPINPTSVGPTLPTNPAPHPTQPLLPTLPVIPTPDKDGSFLPVEPKTLLTSQKEIKVYLHERVENLADDIEAWLVSSKYEPIKSLSVSSVYSNFIIVKVDVDQMRSRSLVLSTPEQYLI